MVLEDNYCYPFRNSPLQLEERDRLAYPIPNRLSNIDPKDCANDFIGNRSHSRTRRTRSRKRLTRFCIFYQEPRSFFPAWNIQYRIVLISNGFKSGFSDRMRAAIAARCGVAQLVAGSFENGPR